MRDAGRKFRLTVLGIVVVAVLPLVRDTAAVGTAISAIGAMVLAFCGANAVVSWQYMKTDSTNRALSADGVAPPPAPAAGTKPNIYTDDERG